MMQCVLIKNPGPNNELIITTEKKPSYHSSQLLVRVYAIGVNRADILQRQGKYPPPPGASPIPGLEIAGEVVSCGKAVVGFKPGDRVYGLVPGGAYAQYSVLEADLAMHIPNDWSYEKAAAIPEALITSYATLFYQDLRKTH